MNYNVTVRGAIEAVARLRQIGRRAAHRAVWKRILGDAIETLRRFAVHFSPVDTGSYQASHRTALRGTEARLGISPTARNTRTSLLVSRYAADVEERHGVYGRVAMERPRVVGAAAKALLREVTK